MKDRLSRIYSDFLSSVIKYFSTITKVLLVGSIVSCYFYLDYSVRELKLSEIGKLKSANNAIYRNIYSNISYAKYQLDYVARQMATTDGDKDKVYKILSSYKRNVNDNFDVVTTWNMYSWIDTQGFLTVDGFDGILDNPLDMNHRDYLPVTKQNPHKVIYGKIVKGVITNRTIMPIAIGVVDHNNNYIGSISFGIDAEKIIAELEISLTDNLSKFLIIDNDKEVLFSSTNITSDEITEVLKKSNLQNSYFDKENFLKVDKLENIAGLNKDLYLVTFADEEIFIEKRNSLIAKIALSYIVIMMFLLFAIAKVYNKIIKPIKLLSQYAYDIIKKKQTKALPDKLDSKEFQNLYDALLSINKHLKSEESLKQELRISNSSLQSLIKSVNHDLRNYVSGVAGLSEIIEDNINSMNDAKSKDVSKKLLDKENLEFVQMIKNQSQEMLLFVKNLLDDDRLKNKNSNSKKDDKVVFHINELIENILFLNKPAFKSHEVNIKTDLANNLPNILENKIRVRQIIDNLVTNAVKYTPKHKDVLISSKLVEDKGTEKIYIEIKDQGIGMTENEIEMALRGDGVEISKGSLDKDFDSHGIGLPLVKNAVDIIGAKIDISSTKNLGTTVRIWINC